MVTICVDVEMLFLIGFRVPVYSTNNYSSLFVLSNYKTNVAAGTFFPRALSLASTNGIYVDFFSKTKTLCKGGIL